MGSDDRRASDGSKELRYLEAGWGCRRKEGREPAQDREGNFAGEPRRQESAPAEFCHSLKSPFKKKCFRWGR